MNKNEKDRALSHDQQGQWSRTKGVLNNEIYVLHEVEARMLFVGSAWRGLSTKVLYFQ